ncbi:KEOPS complex subunit Cgi121 [Candidatus Harpocratesius sp.]
MITFQVNSIYDDVTKNFQSCPQSQYKKKIGFILFRYYGNVNKLYSFILEKDTIDNYLALKDEIKGKFSVSYQVLRSPLVFSLHQLKIILHRINYAFQQKYNISNHPEMELLLYLSLQRQISVAVTFAGGLTPKLKNKLNPKNEKETKIQCDHILFGDLKQVQRAFEYLLHYIPENNIDSWSPPSEEELMQIIQDYGFSYQKLLHSRGEYQSFKVPSSFLSNQLISSQKETEMKEKFFKLSHSHQIAAIEDLFNISNLKQFLENIRPTKLY